LPVAAIAASKRKEAHMRDDDLVKNSEDDDLIKEDDDLIK
jgi:hypothetical protein